MYEIKTGDYVTSKKVLIDGKAWTVNAPGAGDELALGQAKRRSEHIQKKIEAGTATDADFDLYDKLEDRMFKLFSKVFRDGTKDNTDVNAWLNATPMVVIYAIMEDIKVQSEAKEKEKAAETTAAPDPVADRPAPEAEDQVQPYPAKEADGPQLP